MRCCPRCGKSHFNTFRIKRGSTIMNVNKCIVCSFLWIFDEDLKGLAKEESKKFFIETLRTMGKDARKNNTS